MNKENKILLMLPGAAEPVASRVSSFDANTIANLSRQPAYYDPSAMTRKYGSTAIVSVNGPLFSNVSMFAAIALGYNSYEFVLSAIKAALADPAVANIVLDFDSPGGAASEMFELAHIIKSAQVEKPIYAWVGSMACSAAYGLASACKKIFANPAAQIGSVGTMIEVPVQEQPDQDGNKYIRLVATDSALKNADPTTPEGEASHIARLDEINGQFLELLAANRGVSLEFVKSTFGNGAIFSGRESHDRKMVDIVCAGFDEVLEQINKRNDVSKKTNAKSAIPAASAKATVPAQGNHKNIQATEKLRASAVQSERDRVSALANVCAAAGVDSTVLAKAIAEGKSPKVLRNELLDGRVTHDHINSAAAVEPSAAESHERNVDVMSKMI